MLLFSFSLVNKFFCSDQTDSDIDTNVFHQFISLIFLVRGGETQIINKQIVGNRNLLIIKMIRSREYYFHRRPKLLTLRWNLSWRFVFLTDSPEVRYHVSPFSEKLELKPQLFGSDLTTAESNKSLALKLNDRCLDIFKI